MPLIKSGSKKAFSRNVSAEMHAGKPQAQAVAIAYSVKREAAKKKAHLSNRSYSEGAMRAASRMRGG